MGKTIHIFDMDNTVLETPTFADFVGVSHGKDIDTNEYFPEYFAKIKAAFWDELSKEVGFIRMNDFVVPVNKTSKKYFDSDVIKYFSDSKYKSMFEEQDKILVVKPFPGFYSDVDTIGLLANENVLQEYEKSENRMILTGRPESMREKLNYIFRYLGITYPNHGLMLFEHSKVNSNVNQYKINTILDTITKNSWDTVHFYEDRLDWLQNAQNAVRVKFPNVMFVAHHITTVKDKLKLH